MNILKALSKYLAGWTDPDFHKDNLVEIQKTNYGLLRVATLFSAGMCLFLFALTLVNRLIDNLSSFYLLYTIFYAVLALLVWLFVKNKRSLIPLFFYIFAASIFALAIIVGTYTTPELPAVTFFVFLMIIPILFVTRPVYSVVLSVLACTAFCITTIIIKGPDDYYAQTDVLNAICCCIVGIGLDITILNLYLENIRSKSKFKRQSATDELTGLPNRRSFDLHCRELFKKKGDQAKENIFILMMDIDDFKSYNDTYGHIRGDECLCSVSRALERIAKIHDVFLARFGGEEFVAVFTPQTKDEVHKIATRFVECVSQLEIPNEGVGRVITISVGYAGSIDCCIDDQHGLLGCADSAMYAAKSMGKNRASLWHLQK